MAKKAGHTNKFYLISNGTLTEAVYKVAHTDPGNPYVKQSIADGLQDCKVYHENTPSDVLEWLMDRHNSKHRGSGTSLVQFMRRVSTVEAEFTLLARQNNYTAKDGDGTTPYNTLYLAFVQTCFSSNSGVAVKSWVFWDNAKNVVHRLHRFGILEDFYTFCGQRMNFLEPGLNAQTQIWFSWVGIRHASSFGSLGDNCGRF